VKLGFSKNLMYKETDLFHRRLIFITAIFLLLAMVCFARLFQKQVLEHKSYLAMAKKRIHLLHCFQLEESLQWM